MYHVTLVNLAPDAQLADPAFGRADPRQLSATDLGALLNSFRGLDPLQNASADPEIHVHCRRARHIVRTGQGRLMFYDARDNLQPGLVLTVEEILAELDGSAAAARSKPPFPVAFTPVRAEKTPRAPAASAGGARARRFRLLMFSSAAAVLCAGLAGFWWLRHTPSSAADLVSIPAAELASTAQNVEGVYVTGDAPGDRGIVVGADGALRLFQLNDRTAPSFVRDTWQAARHGTTLCLVVVQLDTIAEVADRDTLVYGGEHYRRAAL